MNYTTKLINNNSDIDKVLLVKYGALFESPHAEVHDSHNNELLLDLFQEKNGDIRPDNTRHDWIQFLGDLLSGKTVTDFYNQTFSLNPNDASAVENDIISHYKILISIIKNELKNSPHKAKYLPFSFLIKLYRNQ